MIKGLGLGFIKGLGVIKGLGFRVAEPETETDGCCLKFWVEKNTHMYSIFEDGLRGGGRMLHF